MERRNDDATGVSGGLCGRDLRALVPTVITVGALNGTRRLTGSNFGPCVDIWAQGSDVFGASGECSGCYETRSGSKPAAYTVAGMIASYIETYGTVNATTIKGWLRRHAAELPGGRPVARMPETVQWLDE